jgi:hypothetical protein
MKLRLDKFLQGAAGSTAMHLTHPSTTDESPSSVRWPVATPTQVHQSGSAIPRTDQYMLRAYGDPCLESEVQGLK